MTHYVAVFRDVTEERRAEDEVARLREQLLQSQKLDAVGRLAAGVAHDFNNLLTVICGLGAEVRDDHAGTPLGEDLAAIVHAGERAAVLTRQLLAWSRLAPRRDDVVDLAGAMREAEKGLRRVIGAHVELEVEVEAAVEGACVLADPAHLDQILLNLAVNARDAMPDGGRLRLAVECVDIEPHDPWFPVLPAGPYVRLTVVDTGIGIAPDVLHRVFDPFFTTKERGKGTGLGLATVRQVARDARGDVRIDSERGRGTTVRVVLPRVSASRAEPAVAPAPPLARPGESVLVVDDDPQIRALLGRCLGRLGYDVLMAANAREAAALAGSSRGRISALLTDVVMPHEGGAALARALRADRPDLPVVYATGLLDGAVVEAEPGHVLPKPFTLHGVATALRAAIDGAPASSRSA
jgi:nitrogen-specific signal transduction histidine kinase/ActR/RegA family two-component response regulator